MCFFFSIGIDFSAADARDGCCTENENPAATVDGFSSHSPMYPRPRWASAGQERGSLFSTRSVHFRFFYCFFLGGIVSLLVAWSDQDGPLGRRAGHQAEGVRAGASGRRPRSREQQRAAGVPHHSRQGGVGKKDHTYFVFFCYRKRTFFMSRDTFPKLRNRLVCFEFSPSFFSVVFFPW